jgi:Na+-driven multidrug efflux pump
MTVIPMLIYEKTTNNYSGAVQLNKIGLWSSVGVGLLFGFMLVIFPNISTTLFNSAQPGTSQKVVQILMLGFPLFITTMYMSNFLGLTKDTRVTKIGSFGKATLMIPMGLIFGFALANAGNAA